jgi:hypothetical protein
VVGQVNGTLRAITSTTSRPDDILISDTNQPRVMVDSRHRASRDL